MAYGRKVAELWGAGGHEPDFDLVGNPDNALNPDISAAVSALYFRDHGGSPLIPAAARRGDWLEVRRLVYGGLDTAGAARIGRIAAALGSAAPPPPVDPRDEQIAALTLALKTLRDSTLPAVRAQLDEADRIVRQFAGERS